MPLLRQRSRSPSSLRRRLSGALVGALAIVTIRSMAFEPQVIFLQAGETVRWVNADVVNHQISTGVVTGGRPRPDRRVSSPLLLRGDEVASTFLEAGVYPYYCVVHPFMQGRVVVTPAEAR